MNPVRPAVDLRTDTLSKGGRRRLVRTIFGGDPSALFHSRGKRPMLLRLMVLQGVAGIYQAGKQEYIKLALTSSSVDARPAGLSSGWQE